MDRKKLASMGVWAVAMGAGVVGTAMADGAVAMHAYVTGGEVRGSMENGVIAFKGIPYAAPSTGANRWRAPQPVVPWTGVHAATVYGPDCMQVPFPGDAAPLGVTPAEDCLFVNVWKPVGHPAGTRRARLPVMVWIYGGGFVNGGSSPPEYDGSAFAREGVVLVSFNYRLGNFGFFAHPALSAAQKGHPLGNYAYMDQVAALRWVKRNAAAFGGDPHNVTIFGESAGGMSVHALLLNRLAAGLFQKAIIESGGGGLGLGDRPISGAKDSAQAKGLELAAHFGVHGENAAALEQLRAIPADQLVEGLNMATMGGAVGYVGGPVLDGTYETGIPVVQYAKGKGARVPVMIGTNSMDIGFMQAKTLDDLYAQFGPDAAAARKVYAAPPGVALGAIAFEAGGDQMMVEPARRTAQLLSARGQPVYEYRFSYVADSLRAKTPGAPHATEIPYVFDTVAVRYGKEVTKNDEVAAHAMHAYWVAFAKTGKPEVRGLPEWPAYNAHQDVLMNFTAAGPVAQPDPWKARLDLAQRLTDRKITAASKAAVK